MSRHEGSCHCGAVQFSFEAADTSVLACNCSMCGRTGALMVFVKQDSFTLDQGKDALQDYQFGKKHIHHVFCSTCGLKPFSYGTDPSDGKDTYAVNMRCVHGYDVQAADPNWYDGAAL